MLQTKLLQRALRALALMLALMFLLPACANETEDALAVASPTVTETPAETTSRYDLDITLDMEGKTADVRQALHYANTTSAQLQQLYLHLYPNYFRTRETAPFLQADWPLAYPDGFSPGFIELGAVTLAGEPADYVLEDGANGLMRIQFKRPLKPGEAVDIGFDYKLTIPKSEGRFGYGEETLSLANFYPIASLYENGGFDKHGYEKVGDPFYSDVSDYTVRLTVPEGVTVSGTGDSVSKTRQDSATLYEFNAPRVRDVAYVLSEDFKQKSKKIGETEVLSYYYGKDDRGKDAMNFAADALQIFSGMFGNYDYKRFSVIQSNFYIGGMEYPNAVLISEDLYESRSMLDMLEYTVVHETAHQWWYGYVGNDQVAEPWLDEALTEYSTLLYYREKYGEAEYQRFYSIFAKSMVTGYAGITTPLGDGSMRMNRATSDYDSSLYYSVVVYNYGACMFYSLDKELGSEKFLEALKLYLEQNRYKNAHPAQLLDAIKQVTGRDYSDYLQQWLKGQRTVEESGDRLAG